MSLKSIVFTSALSVILGAISATSYAQDPCASALIKDHFNGSYSSVETLSAFRLRYGSSSQSSTTSAGAVLPLEGLPVNFDFNSASKSSANYFEQSSLQWNSTRLESVATQTLSEAAVEAYKVCRKTLPTTGPRVLVYDATETGATISVAWFSAPDAPTQTQGTVTVEGGSINPPFPNNWKTGQKITRTIQRVKSQDLRVVVNIGGGSDDQFVSQLPPLIPQPSGVTIGSCLGLGGVQGVRLWGPTTEYCNGIPDWGFYDARVRRVIEIGSCLGKGGVEGVRLYGPVGEDCAGFAGWGKYTNPVKIDVIGISSCKGHGNIIAGHDIWGPTGASCGGMNNPQWGKYQVGTKDK